MPYRVNGQYIMEGLASSFLFTVGGLGFVILDRVQEQPSTPRLNKVIHFPLSEVFRRLSPMKELHKDL